MDPSIVYQAPGGPIWDWRVAFDLFCGGIGVGAFLFGVVLDEICPNKYPALRRTAAWMAPLFVVLGLLVLMLKMGRPMLTWLPLVSFAPHAPLWWGGWLQLLFIAVAIHYFVLLGRGERALGARRLVGRIGGVLAVLVGGYHGALLALMPARPLWNTGPTILVAIFAFVTTGVAAVLLVRMLFGSAEEKDELLENLRPVRWFLGIALSLQILASFVWWVQLRYGGTGAIQALTAANDAYGTMFWGLGIFVGLIVPVGLGFWLLRQESTEGRSPSAALLAVLCALVLVGAYFFRLGIVLGGQVPVPAMTLS